VRDFYLGTGKTWLPVYGRGRHEDTDWDRVIAWIDETWRPLSYDGAALFEAFPLPRAVGFEDEVWPLLPGVISDIRL
jgi:hypothetical protein